MGLGRKFAWAVALLWGWLGAAGAAPAAPALWRVQNDHAQIYLFGTLHVLSPGVRWRTPAYDAAYAQAGVVWFEAALDAADPATLGEIVSRYGVDADRPLSRKLPAADVAQLRRRFDLARIDHYRPWVAALMLSMQPALSRGATVEAGADLAMTRVARDDAKTVRMFETLEDQARMFASLSEPAEVGYLTEVIHEHAPRPTPAGPPPTPTREGLEQAWLDGDLARLGAGLADGMKRVNPGLYEALLKRRNQAWAETLAKELDAGSGVELVNVGALHMVGDDGLPALLKARGLAVERVQ